MDYPSYASLQRRLEELSSSGDYAAANCLAEEQAAFYPEYAHLLSLWQIGMSARLRQYPQALAALDRMLTAGFWYDENVLRASSSLKAIWDQAEFQSLLSRNRLLREADPLDEQSLIILRRDEDCQPGMDACPLLVTFHDNSTTASATLEYWQGAARDGWLVAALQSSQAMWKGAYIWSDFEGASDDLREHYQILAERYSTDPRRAVLAGIGRGAEIAARLALGGVIPVLGFIAINPSGPFTSLLEKWEPVLLEPRLFALRGYLVIGQQANRLTQENGQIFTDILNETGIRTELELVPGAGEGYTPLYQESLGRALNFVLQE